MGLLDAPTAAVGGVLGPIEDFIKNPFKKNVKRTYKGQDFAEGFYMVEIVDGVHQKKDALRLVGNMMPHVPFQYGGKQRIKKDYYPGQPEPAVQVLGPEESDTIIKGKLKDKRYKKDSGLYGVATEIAEQMDAIRLRGNLLFISLGEWHRYAFLEKTDFKMNTLGEIEYELSYTIIGFNSPKNCKILDEFKSSPISANKDLIAAALAYQQKYSSIPASMPQSLAGLLNDAISDVAKAINLVTGFVDTVVTTGEDVVKSATRAIGLIKNARANISKFKRRIGAVTFTVSNLTHEARKAAQFKAAYSNQDHIINAMTSTAALSALLARLQSQFEAIAKSTPKARYRTKDTDTLQKIAIKFYGDANQWGKIYDHNKLSSTVLVSGMLLEIPRL